MPKPTHQPSEKTRQTVKDLKSFGITHDEIAKYIGIAKSTMEKHYEEELFKGNIDLIREIASCLAQKARAGDVTAMIFLLKTRGRWRTEDSRAQDTNEEVKRDILELRKKLDAEYKRDY